LQIGHIEERVRERGFLYMADGVTRWGTDILATRAIIDTVKVSINLVPLL
jgi:hypothetical protein